MSWRCLYVDQFNADECEDLCDCYVTEVLHDWKRQEQNELESTKDWPARSFGAKHSWRFYNIHWTWMFWVVEAGTWRELSYWRTEIRHHLLRNCWWVDLLVFFVDINRMLIVVCMCFLGFIKFLGPYYMLIITKRRQIGAICGHNVYAVSKCEIIPLPNSSVQSTITNSENENRSFVSSACKCIFSMVLLKETIDVLQDMKDALRFLFLFIFCKNFSFQQICFPL